MHIWTINRCTSSTVPIARVTGLSVEHLSVYWRCSVWMFLNRPDTKPSRYEVSRRWRRMCWSAVSNTADRLSPAMPDLDPLANAVSAESWHWIHLAILHCTHFPAVTKVVTSKASGVAKYQPTFQFFVSSGVRRSVTRPDLQSHVAWACLVLSLPNYGSVTLAGVFFPVLVQHLQCVMNVAARLMYFSLLFGWKLGFRRILNSFYGAIWRYSRVRL